MKPVNQHTDLPQTGRRSGGSGSILHDSPERCPSMQCSPHELVQSSLHLDSSEDVTNAIRMCHKPNVMSLGQSHSSRYGDLGRSVFVRRRVVLPDHAGKTTGDDHQRAGTGGREMSDPLAIVLCRYR